MKILVASTGPEAMDEVPPQSADSFPTRHTDPANVNSLGRWRASAVRIFVLVSGIAIVLETLPWRWMQNVPFRSVVHTGLDYMGVSQGDWPLFAPDPKLRNTSISAEALDHRGTLAYWNSPDWKNESIASKFYYARRMNYYQRVGHHPIASEGFADYLLRAIPARETTTPAIRWSKDFELLPPEPIQAPVVEIKLYQHTQNVMVDLEAPLPSWGDTAWNRRTQFLVKREGQP